MTIKDDWATSWLGILDIKMHIPETHHTSGKRVASPMCKCGKDYKAISTSGNMRQYCVKCHREYIRNYRKENK